MPVEILLRDEFDNALGQFRNYDAYDQAQFSQLIAQKHIDVRCFNTATLTPRPMLSLDGLTMSELNTFTMQALENPAVAVTEGEIWTAGLIGPQTDRNHWQGVSLACTTGLTTTSSTIPAIFPATALRSVDISALALTDFISAALPAFPLPSINTAQSFIDFTSDPLGSFLTGPTDSLAFSLSNVALVNGDSELRLPISLLQNIDKSKITAVRFRITATGSCTFRCMAIRAISTTWDYAPIDLNTLTQRIVKPVSLNGSLTGTITFPASTPPITPSEWPVVYRSDEPTGNADPRPINLHTSAAFNTGACVNATGANHNILLLRFRELGLDEMTQLDLDGGTFTQATLDALGHQPDFGRSLYDGRTQAELDVQDQGNLDTQTQFSLERVQDFLSAAYLEVKLSWWDAGSRLDLTNANAIGYSFSDFVLSSQSNYILFVDLEEDSLRARIYPLDDQGAIQWESIAYDTTAVVDDSFIHRRKGRFGWYASLLDGDASIDNIRTRGASFSEYRTHPFYSETPTDGARLAVEASPDRDLLLSLGPSPWGGTPTLDNSKSSSGHAYKVRSSSPLQGVSTNAMYLDDFPETFIEFDLWFPSDGFASGAGVTAFLYGEQKRTEPLFLPPIIANRWQHIKIDLGSLQDEIQTGPYSLVIAQTAANVDITWYIDNLLTVNRVLSWQGRGIAADPWGMNDADWVRFGVTVNSEHDGILFAERGTSMQVRGDARRQTGSISTVKILPKYAELGGLVWADEAPLVTTLTPPTFTASSVGRLATFSVTAADSSTISYLWSYGDGDFDYGKTITHTYRDAATYQVTLTTISGSGNRISSTLPVTIS